MEVEMKDGLQHPVAVMGLPINSLTADEAVETLDRLILSGGTHQICPVNVDTWLNALADPHLHRIMAGSTLVLPDGMPLVWAAGLLGCPLAERVTGVDLVPRLAELSARKGYGIFLLGAKPGVAERASRLLERNYPGVQIVGTFAPAEENLIRMDHSEILQADSCRQPRHSAGSFRQSETGKVDMDAPQTAGRSSVDGRWRQLRYSGGRRASCSALDSADAAWSGRCACCRSRCGWGRAICAIFSAWRGACRWHCWRPGARGLIWAIPE